MTASRRELILQTVEAELTPIGLPVFRSRVAALSSKAQAVYLIGWSSDIPEARTSGLDDCEIQVFVAAFVAWDVGAETLADAHSTAAHGAIMADRTKGERARDTRLTRSTIRAEDAELERCAIYNEYLIEYRRAAGSLV